jgi:hypothetical protein
MTRRLLLLITLTFGLAAISTNVISGYAPMPQCWPGPCAPAPNP